jgi:hypothetical protein
LALEAQAVEAVLLVLEVKHKSLNLHLVAAVAVALVIMLDRVVLLVIYSGLRKPDKMAH